MPYLRDVGLPSYWIGHDVSLCHIKFMCTNRDTFFLVNSVGVFEAMCDRITFYYATKCYPAGVNAHAYYPCGYQTRNVVKTHAFLKALSKPGSSMNLFPKVAHQNLNIGPCLSRPCKSEYAFLPNTLRPLLLLR